MSVLHKFWIYLLNFVAIVYVLDIFSYTLTSIVFEDLLRLPFKLIQWCLVRWILGAYIVYRVGLFGWNRYKIRQRLSKKKDELLDKHGRLHAKLLDMQNPKIGTEQVEKWSLMELRHKLTAREITAVDLLDAYQRRALELVRRQTRCVSEIIFDSDVFAILADGKLDTQAPEKLTPIHGIPISVQELFPVRGCDHTMGYACRTNRPAEEDCALVAALKDAGAIPFALTNVRQKLFGLKAENPVFGHVRHPTHPNRACVSGDGLLLHHHGTPLSFAADLLGEARLTAAACGLAAFKPSTGRMSQKGLDLPIRLPRSLGVIATPIAHTIDDIVSVFRSLWTKSLFRQDVDLSPMMFDEAKFETVSNKKIRIGFYTGFTDLMPASPAVERVMQETRSFLEGEGHVVVDFAPPKVNEAYELVIGIVMKFLAPETLKLVYLQGHGDVLTDYRQRAVHLLYAMPAFLKKTLCNYRVDRVETNYAVTSLALRGMGSNSSYVKFQDRVEQYARSFYEEWEFAELDCIICPVSSLPPVWETSEFHVFNCVLLYTALYNLLGCPAGCVRAGRVEKSDVETASEAVKSSPTMNQLMLIARQMSNAEGLPINIQVVAKPWEDELAMGLLKKIEQFMKPSD